MTHEVLLEAFSKDCQLRGITRYRDHVGYVKQYLASLGDKDPLTIDRSDLKSFLGVLHARGLKQSSIDRVFSQLSNFYEFLSDDGMISTNPIPPFRKRYLRTYKKQLAQDVRQLISVEDASRLVNSVLDSRNKAMIVLFLKTGMRLNELLALDVGNVDMMKMEIRLKPTTKRSNRLLFFDSETEEVLKYWLIARKNRNPFGGPALFPSKTSARLSPRGAEYEISKHAAHVGLHDPDSKLLDHRFSPHCFRHWFSTHLYRAGMEERYISWLRGDAPKGSIAPYIHIDPEDVRRAYLAHIPQLGV